MKAPRFSAVLLGLGLLSVTFLPNVANGKKVYRWGEEAEDSIFLQDKETSKQ